MSPAQRTAAQQRRVDLWNEAFPVGTPVTVRRDDGKTVDTTTRSEARMLGCHTAVVRLDGFPSEYLLERVTARSTVTPNEGTGAAAIERLYANRQLRQGVTLSKFQAWAAGATIQLACRHPDFDGPAARVAAELAVQFLAIASDGDPVLEHLAAAGWDRTRDLPFHAGAK